MIQASFDHSCDTSSVLKTIFSLHKTRHFSTGLIAYVRRPHIRLNTLDLTNINNINSSLQLKYWIGALRERHIAILAEERNAISGTKINTHGGKKTNYPICIQDFRYIPGHLINPNTKSKVIKVMRGGDVQFRQRDVPSNSSSGFLGGGRFLFSHAY